MKCEKDDLLFLLDHIESDKSQKVLELLVNAYNDSNEPKLLTFDVWVVENIKDDLNKFPSYKKYIKDSLMVDTKIENNFYDILKLCIESNIQNRNKNLNLVNILGKFIFLKEFCTVRLDYGRQIGKTYTINQLLMNNDVKIFFKNRIQIKDFTKRYSISSENRSIYFLHDMDRLVWTSEPEYIIIDDASKFSTTEMDKFYESLELVIKCNQKLPTILLLG